MENVILLYPKTGFDVGGTVTPPHSLLAIAAPLERDKFQVSLIDQRINPYWERALKDAMENGPVCAGISTMTGSQIRFALEMAAAVRKYEKGSKVPIAWGGPHPSIVPEQTLDNKFVDIVVIGEGDETFLELVNHIRNKRPLSQVAGIAFKEDGKIIKTESRPLMDIEGLLPVPWELLDIEEYIHPDFYLKTSKRTLDIGQTSRGCPYNCGFCCSATLRQRKWRSMSIERSLALIVDSVKKFNLDGIWIRDDNFYINETRIYQICKGMIKADLKLNWYSSGTRVDDFNRLSSDTIEALKMSGANVLKFGAESGSNRILELMHKGIKVEQTFEANLKAKKFGIIPAFSFIAGFPTETFDEINMTIDAMTKIKKDNPRAQLESICIYTAFPGTPMYELAVRHGLRPQADLLSWAKWNFHEYNLKDRNPWFPVSGMKKLGNLTYMSSLSNIVPNLINSIENRFIRIILTLLIYPISRYFALRLRMKRYTFAPELSLFHFIRYILFDAAYAKLQIIKKYLRFVK